jgi:two-component system alkaline phosphatase synthesis response regulator PhoP
VSSDELRPLILLADDEEDVSLVARTRLEVNGFEVVTAADGAEALDRFRERRPDLVLLDLRMPRMNGYEVCQVLKTDPATRDVPVIIFSASSSQSQELERRCLELGADDYIRKPYNAEQLVARVRKQLARCPAEARDA